MDDILQSLRSWGEGNNHVSLWMREDGRGEYRSGFIVEEPYFGGFSFSDFDSDDVKSENELKAAEDRMEKRGYRKLGDLNEICDIKLHKWIKWWKWQLGKKYNMSEIEATKQEFINRHRPIRPTHLEFETEADMQEFVNYATSKEKTVDDPGLERLRQLNKTHKRSSQREDTPQDTSSEKLPKQKVKRITFNIPEHLHKQLKWLSVKEDMTMLEIGETMAREFIDKRSEF